MYTQTVGTQAEELARRHLENHGLTFLTNNFSCRYGEIDLIMLEGEMIVFVEVRYRQRQDYGGALESVDFRKQQKLIRTAMFFLQQHGHTDTFARIDVIALSRLPDGGGTYNSSAHQEHVQTTQPDRPSYRPEDEPVQWIRSAVEIT